jgi:hypothetical protein
LNVALLDHAPNQAIPNLIANLVNDSLDESREPDTTPRKNAIDHEGSTQPEPAYSSLYRPPRRLGRVLRRYRDSATWDGP